MKLEISNVNFKSLSLFRIFFAALLLFDLFTGLWPDAALFFSDRGVMPRDYTIMNERMNYLWSIFYINGSIPFVHAIFSVYFVSLLAILVGYRTRLAVLIALIVQASINWRNPGVSAGSDLLVRLFLLWGLFAPLNRYWSIDAALDSQSRDRATPIIPLIGIKAQVSILYLFSGLYKVDGSSWVQGKAVGMAISDYMFGSELGLALAQAAPALCYILTYAVVAFQLCFSLLIYSPLFNTYTRAFALAGAVAMHLSFAVLLKVGYFPYLCIVYLLLLIPDSWLDFWWKPKNEKYSKWRIYYEPGCRFCNKISLLFREFCLVPSTPVLSADKDSAAHALLKKENSWVVVDHTGASYTKWNAVAHVMRQNVIFKWLGILTDTAILRPAMERLYVWIGEHRKSLSVLTTHIFHFRKEEKLSHFWQLYCAFLIIVTIAYNICVTPVFSIKTAPRWLTNIAGITLTIQRWNLFAPNPVNDQHRLLLEGTLNNGASVDIIEMMGNKRFLHLHGDRLKYPTHRWSKYYSRLYITENKLRREHFAKDMCQTINSDIKSAENQLKDITFILYVIRPYEIFNREKFKPRINETYDCKGPRRTKKL